MDTGLVRNVLIALLLGYSSLSFANDTFIPPYSATYSTVWKKGISLKVEGRQQLKQLSQDAWLFEFSATTFLASLKETVRFRMQNQQLVPMEYQYRSSVFGKKREATLTFDWHKKRVRNDVKGHPWYMDVPEGALDKLGVQLQIRQDLKQGRRNFSYQIADGGKLKTWTFETIGQQSIKTNLGRLHAIKVIRTDNQKDDRQSTFWFAPSMDYLLVKMIHEEHGESYLLELESVK